jgi:hypothetical protein
MQRLAVPIMAVGVVGTLMWGFARGLHRNRGISQEKLTLTFKNVMLQVLGLGSIS